MFSLQQELSDKMMCQNAKHIIHKYDLENNIYLEHQIAGRMLERDRLKGSEGKVNDVKEVNKINEKKRYQNDISSITNLNSHVETCTMFGFPIAK